MLLRERALQRVQLGVQAGELLRQVLHVDGRQVVLVQLRKRQLALHHSKGDVTTSLGKSLALVCSSCTLHLLPRPGCRHSTVSITSPTIIHLCLQLRDPPLVRRLLGVVRRPASAVGVGAQHALQPRCAVVQTLLPPCNHFPREGINVDNARGSVGCARLCTSTGERRNMTALSRWELLDVLCSQHQCASNLAQRG